MLIFVATIVTLILSSSHIVSLSEEYLDYSGRCWGTSVTAFKMLDSI